MDGKKWRGFLPDPEELRHRYGDNAAAAASIYGSVRPVVYAVMILMVGAVVTFTVFANSRSSSGWSVAVAGLAVGGTAILLTGLIIHKARQVASLRSAGSHSPESPGSP